MMEKKIVFLISSPPFETLNNYEALRASISFIDHAVAIIWMDEGVNFTLKSVDKTMTKTFLRLADDMEVGLYVSEEDLLKKNLDHLELEDVIKKIDQEDILITLRDADIVMTF
jgi:sulfur relay (sulfurtransferase) DsrF/TusC family protein